MTALFANNGVGMRPQLLFSVVDANGQVIKKFESAVGIEKFASDKNIKIIQEGMRQTILAGSGRRLNTLPISSAGKTGTSQFDGSDPSRTHAWFTAYAPFENPEIVMTVLVEAGGGGDVAAVPIVNSTLQWWAENRYRK
jgi:cell division protein FtsI/penicillin-binding protein 2